jgi:ABC-type glycerol-3-phosphate transport system permease component
MANARLSTGRTIAAHAILITYTLIALFPAFVVVINSFKSRKAIFADPLALPSPGNFDLVGYETVMKQGDFFAYFQNSLIFNFARLFFVLLFGEMAAFALSEYRFKGNADGAVSGAWHHESDPVGHRCDPRVDGGGRFGEYADGAGPCLYRAGATLGRVHPV